MTDDVMKSLLDIDRALHEPARLIITSILYAVKEADFTFLVHESGLTRGNLSSHLSKLEEVGYVAIEKTYKGKRPLTICSLTDTGQAAYEEYRSHLRHVLDELPSVPKH